LSTSQTPAVLLTMRAGKPGGGKGPLLAEEQSLTLATGNGQTLFQPQAFDEMNFTTNGETHHVLRAGTKQSTGVVVPQAFRKSKRAQSDTDDETWVADGGANTLNVFDVGDTRTTHAIVEPTYSLQGSLEGRSDTSGPGGKGWKEDESFTLNTADRHSVVAPSHAIVEPKEEMVDFGRTSDRIRINAQTAATLQSGGGGGGAKTGLYMQQYGVRRLTPVECERLQSFPDGWTEPAGSDSARYKAMGNAVTVNVVRWILGRLQ
jgi:site-specific DNA-cytosine methylase